MFTEFVDKYGGYVKYFLFALIVISSILSYLKVSKTPCFPIILDALKLPIITTVIFFSVMLGNDAIEGLINMGKRDDDVVKEEVKKDEEEEGEAERDEDDEE